MFRLFIIFVFVSLSNSTNDFPIQAAAANRETKNLITNSKTTTNSSNVRIPEIHVGGVAEVPTIHLHPNPADEMIDQKVPTSSHANKSATTTKKPLIKMNGTEMESGAFVRGLLVFVALSMLFLIYLAFKTYRGRSRKSAMVRKYGVRTPRNDVEMTPLPLDEDDDDETLFDVGSVNRQ